MTTRTSGRKRMKPGQVASRLQNTSPSRRPDNPPAKPQGGAERLTQLVESLVKRGMSQQAIRRSLRLSEADVAALCLTLLPRKGAPKTPSLGDIAARTLKELQILDCTGALEQRIRCQNLPMADILAAVVQVTGFSEAMLLGPRQMRPLVHARQLVMHLLRELCPGATTPAIGLFLNRDHTTVLYGLTRAGQLICNDTDFATQKHQVLALLCAWVDARESQGKKTSYHACCTP